MMSESRAAGRRCGRGRYGHDNHRSFKRNRSPSMQSFELGLYRPIHAISSTSSTGLSCIERAVARTFFCDPSKHRWRDYELGVHIIRLRLGRRLINIFLSVTQRTKCLNKWRRRQDHGSLVVSSNLTSTMKTLFKESEFPHEESDK